MAIMAKYQSKAESVIGISASNHHGAWRNVGGNGVSSGRSASGKSAGNGSGKAAASAAASAARQRRKRNNRRENNIENGEAWQWRIESVKAKAESNRKISMVKSAEK